VLVVRARALLRAPLCILLGTAGGLALAEDDPGARVGLLLRTDTDGTHVVSPSAGLRTSLVDEETYLDLEYTADVWTSASVDVRTAATRAVYEQRDEINGGIERIFDDFRLRGGYRFSIENDYESHGGTLSGTMDLADNAANLELRLTARHDLVGRSGDPGFRREHTLASARITYTQVLDTRTVLQGAYEFIHGGGYMASPYRFVGVGGDGRCAGSAQLCVPETHPDSRTRHALVLRGRRALGARVSGHLDYRFYADDWGLVANTAALQLTWAHDDDGLVALRYRIHQQGAASFYRSTYPVPTGALRFVTRDRELSPLWTHRIAVSYERSMDLGEAAPRLRVAGALGGTLLDYQDFVGLGTVLAVDVTLTLGVLL
jgi:hypothetical protein